MLLLDTLCLLLFTLLSCYLKETTYFKYITYIKHVKSFMYSCVYALGCSYILHIKYQPITLLFVQFCDTSSTTMMLAALRFQESRCKNLSGFFTLCLFLQQHDTADKCSGWLSNPGFWSSSTDSQFAVICKCKEWTLHYHKDHHWKEEAMTVIAQNVSQYWKQICSIYSWKRFQTFVHSFVFLHVECFPWLLVRTTQKK